MSTSKHTFDPYWLAGLIDGDGYFGLSKAGYVCLEVTSSSHDHSMFKKLQACYGGSIKPRAGTASVRWRLTKKPHLQILLQHVNGKLQNTVRKTQFVGAAQKLGLTPLNTEPYNWNTSYFAGLFDSDGKITLSVKSVLTKNNLKGMHGKKQRLLTAKHTQLTIGVTQKYAVNVAFLKNPYFGVTYYDRSQNGYTTWCVSSKKDVGWILLYFKKHPSQSIRNHRLNLVPHFYAAKQDSNLWPGFVDAWFKYDI